MEEKMLPHITNRIYHQQTPTHTMKNVKVGTSGRRQMIPDANLDLYNENGKWKIYTGNRYRSKYIDYFSYSLNLFKK